MEQKNSKTELKSELKHNKTYCLYIENNFTNSELISLKKIINQQGNITYELLGAYEREIAKTNNHLIKIDKTISSIPDGSYPLTIISGLLSACVAAGAAFLLNYLFWRKIRKHNRVSHFAQLSIEHLDLFEKITTEYWSTGYNKNRIAKNKILEARIKSNFIVLKTCLEEFKKRVPDKFQNDKKIITTFIEDIFEIATGDQFESSQRKPNLSLSKRISVSCSSIKSLLIRYSQTSTL
ncbi:MULTISPECIES: hypothetical protein [Shewanella]|uniref:hypothetical protein n=1 Tax=Shewanella TaxID=22 RepID=UPI0011844C73|nr:hypothetical protein [Shewanella algae]MBO2617670.1 hypothetical protein [Shewanella algae]TVK91301.1 hypothetical protein AYJ01_19060 [Shewanella algae]TVK93785.1 hypothetical protein AYJ01_09145 [Shewanella algae]